MLFKICYTVNLVRLELMTGDRTRETVAISSCVRGYHVYKDRWKPRVGEKLACVRESTNIRSNPVLHSIPSYFCSLFRRIDVVFSSALSFCRWALLLHHPGHSPVCWRYSSRWNRERQATMRIRQHAFLRSGQTLEVLLDRHLFVHVATGEGNLRYHYFWVGLNFSRFNFRHAVAVRK